MNLKSQILAAACLLFAVCPSSLAAPATQPKAPGDRMLDEYFRLETAKLSQRCLADIKTLADWESKRGEYRRQLLEMLGLWPEPPRTDLKPLVTGTLDHGDFIVEKIQFQSRPGLYVTADLFRPKVVEGKIPAILYVCGHSLVKKDGVSYGNKTFYQHHGEWFARNGYVCMVVDSLQLGEIEGIHHGLYREKMWWWMSRGYTPAGVEAWNDVRCIDYLQTRPEVDADRIGMTGRSGGGAYTWYTAAIDERVKVVVPVAGITDMQNHIVDGTIEGHCDCMFMTNTYRWDFPLVAALIAPRPMLISNSDKDTIFPLDGVQRLHAKTREIYKLYKAEEKLGLLITEGPHMDTQDLQVPAFRWFNRFFKNETGPLKDALAEKVYEPEQLRVFPAHGEPADAINAKIQETFIPVAAAPEVPGSKEAWERMKQGWIKGLKERVFRAWPQETSDLRLRKRSILQASDLTLRGYDFTSQEGVTLQLLVAERPGPKPAAAARLRVLDQQAWEQWVSTLPPSLAQEVQDKPRAPIGAESLSALASMLKPGEAAIWFAPRGVGPTAWTGDEKRRTHILRRFWLLGQTLDGMRVWDVRRAVQAIRQIDGLRDAPITLDASGKMAGVALYAAIFEPAVKRLELKDLPASHRQGPQFANVLKVLDLPAAVAIAAEGAALNLTCEDAAAWEYPAAVAKKLSWPAGRLQVIEARK